MAAVPNSISRLRAAALSALPLFAAALWWGSLSVIGFMAVPMLFANLATPAIAGGMAAKLFSAQSWVSIACSALLLLVAGKAQQEFGMGWARGALAFVLAGMLLALIGEFGVAPRIIARQNLAFWHSLGTILYLAQWLCAGAVLWKLAPRAPA